MNYLQTLPKNVHEDIVGKVIINQPYSISIAKHREIKNNNAKEGDYEVLQFYQIPNKIPEHVLSSLTEKQKRLLKSDGKFKYVCLRKIIMKGNIFIGQSYNSPHNIPRNRSEKYNAFLFVFDSNNNKVYFKDEHICLDDKSNDFLKNYLRESFHCDSCSFSEIKDKSVFISTCCHNCLKTFKKHKRCLIKSCYYLERTPEDFYYEYKVYMDVCNECVRTCGVCNKNTCIGRNHSSFCKNCNIYLCQEHLKNSCPNCNEFIYKN